MATLMGAAAAGMAVREGARAFVAPSVVTPEELAVSAPALPGATVEPSTSSGSTPLTALSVGVVGATAVKMASRRRATKRRAQAVARQASSGVQETPKSWFEELYDRWNTKGGAVLITFIGLGASWALEKLLEAVFGWDLIQAGIATSGFLTIMLLIWTSQYLFRVATKTTTYAEQLKNYEREVMIRRISELSDEEIDAICMEVGVNNEELEEALTDVDTAGKVMTRKEKVIELFRSQKFAAPSLGMDPRGF